MIFALGMRNSRPKPKYIAKKTKRWQIDMRGDNYHIYISEYIERS